MPDDTPAISSFDAARRLMQEVVTPDEGASVGGAEPSAAGSCEGLSSVSIPGYTLDSVVGRGGGGVVYRAYSDATGQAAAVKIITRPLGGDAATKRAWRELHLLSELRLPCLPQVRDFGEVGGRLFIVTDFIDGQPLDAYCSTRDLPLRPCVEVLVKAAEALQSLHEHRLIHRDIKPANLLVDSHGKVIIVDLGIAALFGENTAQTITEEGVPIGSPAFMSPEQARGERAAVTTRSDVYSLGATAYYILTGQTPHDCETTILEAVRRVGRDAPRPPRELSATLPRPLAAVLYKCVAPRPGDRYSSAQAFGEDLQRWLRGEAVEATPPNLAQRFGRLIGRHPIVTTAGACAAILALTVVLSYVAVLWLNERPWKVVNTLDGSSARLLSRSGMIIREWSGSNPDDVAYARLISDHPLVRGKAILLGMAICTDPALSGRLALIDASNPSRIIWKSNLRDAALGAPGLDEPIDASMTHIEAVALCDIMPDQPGEEILATHLLPTSCASVIRVYSVADGRVLYEAWHRGHLYDVHWLSDPGLIIAAGSCNAITWCELGYALEANHVHATVVFAIRPSRAWPRRWISFRDSDIGFVAEWYRCLWPPAVSQHFQLERDAFEAAAIETQRGSKLRLLLRSHYSNAGGALTIDESGSLLERTPSDTYEATRAAAVVRGEGNRYPEFDTLELRDVSSLP